MAEAALSFAELLARGRAGDNTALAEIARQYEPEIRIMARVLLGPALRPYLDSMDLVQSVHRSLMLGLRQQKFDLSSPDRIVALALTVVRRKVARQWRRHQRQKRPGDASLELSLSQLVCPECDPAKAAQVNDAIQHVCQMLKPAEREVLELRLQGLSTADVARKLGLDSDVLRVQLTRLRQRLRANGILDEWL